LSIITVVTTLKNTEGEYSDMSEHQHREQEQEQQEEEEDPDRKNVGRQNGQWTSTVSDADILAAVEEHSPAATSEVGEAVDMTRPGAYKRLTKLHESGSVEKKKIAASVVWFLSE
jgi:predicted transcriptional regulator